MEKPLSERKPPQITLPPVRPAATREFVFTTADFERIRKLIHAYAGISLADTKQDMVYSRLARRLRETQKKTFGEYLDLLERGDKAEWERFVNSLTTNLTSFFREPHHFPILAAHLKKLQGKSPIRIWCSAASTGEEPYSIAMTAVETFNSFNIPVTILASDLDTNVLSVAANGVYTADRVDKLTPERLSRFFTRTGDNYTVKPELRRMLSFQRINLLETNWPVRGPLDILFCRNVMIYFPAEAQRILLQKLYHALAPGGLLFVGHAESLANKEHRFRYIQPTIYMR